VGKSLHYCIILFLFWSCADQYSRYALPPNSGSSIEMNAVYGYDKLDHAMEDYPESTDLKILKLKIFQQNNWDSNQDKFIESILQNDEYNPIIYELIAKYYLSHNDIGKAVDVTNRAEEQGSNAASFYELKSLLYSRLGKFTASIDYINKAILLNRSDYKSYYTKGKIYLNLGDTTSAIKYMKLGLSHFKNNYEILYEISDLYEKTKLYDKAEKLITNTILFAPKEEKLRIKYAEILLGQNKIQQARLVLKSSFLEHNSHIKSALMLSDIFMQNFLYDSVINVSNQILSIDSVNIFALRDKAQSYDKKGFYTSAMVNYELILAQDSLFENAREEWQNVKTKRAYLQKIKERKVAMPVFDIITPKKN